MSEQTFIKGLYLVATPIGNLGDISARAVEVLKTSDLIACEDTRVTSKLLSYLGISAKLTPYHEHNAEKVRPQLIERLKNGEMIAQVSDAGTPIVSDPGYRLVQDCIENGIYFTAIPGASAVLTALQLSGLPSHRWLFEGPAAVARELTKKFEQTVRGTFSDLLAYYDRNGQPKGEIVIVVAPPLEQKAEAADIDDMLKKALETMRVKDAAAFVAELTGVSKKELYQRALELK